MFLGTTVMNFEDYVEVLISAFNTCKYSGFKFQLNKITVFFHHPEINVNKKG